ncbi:MAG: hypothetical protein ACI4P3_01605 [Candidatus Spyradosoma sp.]
MSSFSFFARILSAAALCALAGACSPREPQSRIDVVDAMTETLQGVQDKATADAAAEKFAALVGELDRFGPSAESDAALADERVSRLAAQVSRLAKEDCFESEALKRALGTPAKTETAE